MKFVYTQYFQKSKVFLYPLLKLKKGIPFVPVETYICWDGVYGIDDFKYLCVYHSDRNDKFLEFESSYLLDHKMLDNKFSIDKDKQLYVFNLKGYKYDFQRFLEGKYSKFSMGAQSLILNYFGSVGNISEYILSVFDPEDYHDKYAEALDVPIKSIQDVYEVCSVPDLEKETLFAKVPEQIELFKNNSIHLNKL